MFRWYFSITNSLISQSFLVLIQNAGKNDVEAVQCFRYKEIRCSVSKYTVILKLANKCMTIKYIFKIMHKVPQSKL